MAQVAENMNHFAQGVTRTKPARSIFSSQSAAPRIVQNARSGSVAANRGALLLGVRCRQYLAAGGGHLRERHRRLRLRRLCGRLRMEHRILEPVGEIARAAAFAVRWLGLALAIARAGGAFDADMEMIVVAVHWPHLGEPAAVALGFPAQRFLDRGVDEDALHVRLPRRVPDHGEM